MGTEVMDPDCGARATVDAQRAFLPPEASTRKPVAMIASARPDAFEKAVRNALDEQGVDGLLVSYVPPVVTGPGEVAAAIVRGAALAAEDAAVGGVPAKPVLSCFMGTHGVPEGLRSLHRGHIPSYSFPEPAVIALARAASTALPPLSSMRRPAWAASGCEVATIFAANTGMRWEA